MSTRPSQRADIAILVALEKELDAVLRSAGSWERHQTSSDIRTYYTSTTPAGLSVVAVRSSGMGQINAALLARDVVALFKPLKVFLVGIAGGLGNEVALGDIVVSDRIVDYEIGKVTPTGTTPRWSVYGSDALLRERLLDHRDLSWLARVRTARPDGDKSARPTIRSGIVLSGNKVIADATAAGALAEVWSRASAIEMEAAGIAAALDQSVDAPGFVMVKAICDRADASKDDSWQEYAAEVAAAFVASFVFGFLEPSDARRGQKRDLPDLPSDKAIPALPPQRPTIRENSAAEILGNLKGITLSYRFREKVEELYLGRWTREPGWQATVEDLPTKLSGGRWRCSFMEVGSDTLVWANTAQDISMLRPGDSVTVSGRISAVSQIKYISLEDASIRGDNVPLP